ncbi:MAG: hypothetical protein PHS21_06605 [Atribacterota bacterium]|nr:hypothetical protein [Atribacterota bacterium]
MEINSKVIGILGTAKNTGKTTTASYLLEWSNKEGIKVGLTSIGYDGEDIDNITGLPKPRIYVKQGDLVGTAKQCFSVSEAKIEIVEKTSVKTSPGQVLIGKVLQGGLVILAGPNKGKDLLCILQKLKKEKSQLILVDGALNRMIPLINCDALILATGASRQTDIDLLVDETESIIRAFNIPLREKQKISNQEIIQHHNNIVIFQKNGYKRQLKSHSLISQKTLSNLIDSIDEKETEEIYIPGIFQDNILKKISEQYSELFKGKTILVNNPTFLLVGTRDINHLMDIIEDILNKGIKIKTLYNLPILAVTINPFYPKYSRFGKDSYEMAWIDGYQLYQKMRNRLALPIINIMGEESPELVIVIKKFLNINK